MKSNVPALNGKVSAQIINRIYDETWLAESRKRRMTLDETWTQVGEFIRDILSEHNAKWNNATGGNYISFATEEDKTLFLLKWL